MPPLPPALPIFAPLEDDKRRNALCRKPGCPDFGEVAGGGGDEISGFLTSFATGVEGAPKAFGCSVEGIEAGFSAASWAGGVLAAEGLAPEENLELKLVIHELRLPSEGDLGSFALLVGVEGEGAVFSEEKRVWREGLTRW